MAKKISVKKASITRKEKPGKSTKLSDEEQVVHYMDKLSHPLKKEIEAVRNVIKGASSNLSERIKWNAPSYYYKEDLVTFNPRADKFVHLVFHHIAITKINSSILKGDYKDRRMVYFNDMTEVNQHKKELQRIMKELVKMMGK